MTILFYLIIVLAAWSGFFITLYIRHKKKKNEVMVCYIGQDCQKVVHSKYSVFLGIPVELLGGLYYAIVSLGYGALVVFPYLVNGLLPFFLFLISVAAFLFSIYLISIQAFTLKEWCTWCLFSAGLSTIIFIFSSLSLGPSLNLFLSDIRGILIIIHLVGVAIGVGAASITDIFFFKFLKDFRIVRYESDILHTLSQIIWLALGILVISGLGLLLPKTAILLASSKFLTKLMIVAIIIINGILLNLYISPRIMEINFKKNSHNTNKNLSRFRKIAFASGAISLTSWYSVLILGSLRSIPMSVFQAFFLYLVLITLAITISQLIERSMGRRVLLEI